MGKRDAEDDESAFPRGGGGGGDFPRGALSDRSHDSEKKSSGKRRKTGGGMFDDDSMPFGHARTSSSGSKEKTFVESLKYKTLRVGMKLLGVVTEVTERGMHVSLPNGLKGTVTRAEAADAFAEERTRDERNAKTKKKKKTKKSGGSEEEEEDDKTGSDDGSDSDSDSYSSDDEFSDSDAADDVDGAPPLSLAAAFSVGQIVRCLVRRLDKGKSGGKRIDLTTRVSALLSNIASESHLRDGVNVPAEVRSCEDHGFVLSFGVAGAPPGFLPRKAAPQGRALVKGSVLDVVLTGADRDVDDAEDGDTKKNKSKASKASKPRGALSALSTTADRRRVASAVTHESDTVSVSTLLPGMLVNARIKAVLADGVSANFMTYFVATVDAFHVGDAVVDRRNESDRVDGPAIDLAKTHRVGERCRARVLFVDHETKRVGLSLRPHLVNYGAPRTHETSGVDDASHRAPDAASIVLGPDVGLPPLGFVCETAVVRRVDKDVGVLLEVESSVSSHGSHGTAKKSSKTLGYCHISDASDAHVENLTKLFKPNQRVRCRVVGRRAADGVSVLSCRKSVIDQPFLSADELEPGMRVRGEVVSLEPYGAMVRLAPGVKALCPPHHVSDVPGRVSSAKVKEGAKLQFRVLHVDRVRNRVSVTHKKTLVKSDLSIVSCEKDAIVGKRCHGVVTGVEPYGVFVQLFGVARGLAGLQDLGLSEHQAPKEAYAVGQCVRCTVVRADDVKKLKLSLVDASEGAFGGNAFDVRGAVDFHDFETNEETVVDDDAIGYATGTVFPAVTVRSIEPESRTVRVVLPDGSSGAITAAHVSDHPETGAALVGTLKSGDEIGPVVVLESGKPGKGRRAVLSRKQTLVSFASREALPETVADVAVGASYPGYVASVASGGVFVRFLGRLTGLCPPSGFQTCFSGVTVDASDRFALGQTVVARVTAVDATASPPRVSLTLAGAGGSKREQKTKTAASYEVDADPDSFLVRAVFADAEALDVLAEKCFAESSANGETETETGQAVALTRESVQNHFAPGSRLGVVATAIKPYGVLAEAAEDDDAVCLLANAQTPATSSLRSQPSKKSKSKSKTGTETENAIAVGDALDVVVLDVDRREGVVDVGARAGLLSGLRKDGEKDDKKNKKKKTSSSSPALGAEVAATLELVKPEYVVVSLPEHGNAIGYCATRAFNAGFGFGVNESRRDEDGETIAPFGGKKVGDSLRVTVVANAASKSPGGRLLLRADAEALGDSTDSNNGGFGSAGGSALAAHPVGASFEASVREVAQSQLILDLPGGGRGRLHATEHTADRGRKGDRVFGSVKIGDAIRVVVLGPAGDRGSMLELSARRTSSEAKALFAAAADAGAGDGGGAGVCGAAMLATHEHGDVFEHGIVSAVSNETLAITVAPGLTVRVPRIETASDVKELKTPLAKRFSVGASCGALTVLTSDIARKKMTCTLRSLSDREVVLGAVLPAIVAKVEGGKNGGCVFAQLTGTRRGRAHACDLSDDASATEPWKKFAQGDVVNATVLSVSDDGGEIDLSFKKTTSSGSSQNDILASLQPGGSLSGYVKNVTKGGVFVAVARDVDARVKMCNLSDAFVDDPIKAFPKGFLVRGVALFVDTAARQVEMTLRSDGVDASAPRDKGLLNGGSLGSLPPLQVGLVTMGTVRRVQTYGVFVTLDGSGRSGLCHISAFADARIKDSLEAHVRAGERVRVKVLEVDEATGRVSLGMKPSLFTDEDEEEEDKAGLSSRRDAEKKEDVLVDDGDEEEEEEEEEDEDEEEEEEEEDDEEEEEDDDDEDVDDSDAEEVNEDDSEGGSEDDLVADDASSEDEDEAMDVDEETDSDAESESDADSDEDAPTPMDDDGGLDWDADDTKKNARAGSDDLSKDGDLDRSEKPLTKREKARLKAAREMELHKKEQSLKARADAAPETASEFEKALMGNPKSSFLWIRYAAFHVSVGAYDEARAVAERALKAIPSSDQDEKMNVWIMYLNLENVYGKPNPRDAVSKLFKRAVSVANPKKLHLALASTHERSGDFDAQAGVLQAATKKFSQSAKVWIAYARCVILAKKQTTSTIGAESSKDPDAVKKVLDRASQSLPKRKVVKVLVQVALVEIREGSKERGRSVFESVLRNYPRRTDIWSTYVDQEIKMFGESGDPERCRGLLERATHLELNPKAMKFLFKRYLDFERRVGDKKRVEHVKERAMEYVANKFG